MILKTLCFSLLFFFAAASYGQQFDDHAVGVRVDPILGSVLRGGPQGVFRLPLPIGMSAHLGWSTYDATSSEQSTATGWLDVGLSLHNLRVTSGFNPGVKIQYSLGLRDGSGWRFGLYPMGQLKTSDDNLLTGIVEVEGGSTALEIGATLDWQWCFEHIYFGPRLGYSLTASKPILGGLVGWRM